MLSQSKSLMWKVADLNKEGSMSDFKVGQNSHFTSTHINILGKERSEGQEREKLDWEGKEKANPNACPDRAQDCVPSRKPSHQNMVVPALLTYEILHRLH